MPKIRIIPRLDIKGENLVKGVNLEGLRIIGSPSEYAKKYYENGADEIYYEDTVASLYGRNNLSEVIKKTAKQISIPLIVGGGLRSIEDIKEILKAGADKVSINSEAVINEDFIKKAVEYFGSSTIILNINYKSWPNDSFLKTKNVTVDHGKIKDTKNWNKYFQVYIKNGREQTGIDAFDWACKAEKLGVGEIILTSIDKEGTKKGFENYLTKKLCSKLSIPTILSGGCSQEKDVSKIIQDINCDAVSIASALHYNFFDIQKLKIHLSEKNIGVIFHEKI